MYVYVCVSICEYHNVTKVFILITQYQLVLAIFLQFFSICLWTNLSISRLTFMSAWNELSISRLTSWSVWTELSISRMLCLYELDYLFQAIVWRKKCNVIVRSTSNVHVLCQLKHQCFWQSSSKHAPDTWWWNI